MLDHSLSEELKTRNNHMFEKLREMNTTIKLLIVFALLFMNVFFRNISFSLFVSLSAFVITIIIGVSFKEVFKRIKLPILFGIFIFFMQALFLKSGEPVIQILGIGIYSDGIIKGLKIFLTLVGSVWYLVLVGLTSNVDSILSGFKSLGIPEIVINISLMMYRYSLLLYEEAIRVFYAQKSRLGYTNFKNSIKSLGQLWGIIIVNSLIRSIRVNEAMKSRNFTGKLFFDFRKKPNTNEILAGFSYILFFLSIGIIMKYFVGV